MLSALEFSNFGLLGDIPLRPKTVCEGQRSVEAREQHVGFVDMRRD